jgi:inhibitor of cysteine peptidase
MRPWVRLTIAVLLGAVCVLAPPPVPAEKATGEKPVVVTEKEDGKTVQVPVGGNLLVRLASNPSTGYQWEGGELQITCLEAVGRPSYEGPGIDMPGAGGTQVFTYVAVKPGTARLSFHYARPWEKKAPAKAFAVNVTILCPAGR